MSAVTGSDICVLHVLEALSYGTSRHVIDVVRHTSGVRHHVVVPALRSAGITDTSARPALEAAGARVHVVDMRRNPVHPANAAALIAITRLARQLDVDVLHGHSAIGGALARAVPLKLPKVYTPNGLMPRRSAMLLERMLGRATTRFVAVSWSEAQDAVRFALVPQARVVVIPNGIDLELPGPRGKIREAVQIGPETPLVGSIMRLAEQKAPEDFVAMATAVASIRPDVHFVLVGDGPLATETDRAGAALGPRFHRIKHLVDASASVADLNVFVLLSRYEGGPYVPLEAARASVPLVLSDVTGNRDVVEPATSGVIVPFGEPGLAADQVLGLLENPKRGAAFAAAMTQRLTERFDVKDQGAAHKRLYQQLAREKSSSLKRR